MRKTIFNEDAEAQLLAIRCSFEGKVAENKQLEMAGKPPKYNTREFGVLAADATRIGVRLANEGIENRKIIDSL